MMSVFILFFLLNIALSAEEITVADLDNELFNKGNEINFTVECTKVPENGLFSFLMRIVEWIYCIKQEKHLGLYINMTGAYGFSDNTFSMLFKPFKDHQITTTRPSNCPVKFIPVWPSESGVLSSYYVTSGFKNYNTSIYVYSQVAFCSDPDFLIFRNRLHPIIAQYMQPVFELQNRIDNLMQKMNQPSIDSEISNPNYKIGIHIRCMEHYQNCTKSPAEFLDDIENDVDQIMELHDPHHTSIYLATLLEPVVERLSAKYKVVVCDTPRIPDVKGDWTTFAYHLDSARDAVVDTWCLANCDELWGSSSNMIIFAGCLNPSLKIFMLPSLSSYNGN